MLGKEECRILKEIRRQIADANDIPYVTRDCRFQGECRGTCPRCESELRYLEKQLEARAALGKKVSVAALCAGMALSAAGCAPIGRIVEKPVEETELSGAVAYYEPTPEPTPEIEIETGEVAWPEDELSGMVASEPEPTDYTSDLTGDVAWPEGAGVPNG